MFESALRANNYSFGKRITLKALVSAGIIALAVLLPQLVHMALGQPGGVKWLPMYLPVLLGGCFMGFKWGAVIGILSPAASFLITTAAGNPMPVAARLPYMMIELAVFAAVTGLFSGRIAKNTLWAFPAVICAQLCGRAVFLGTVALFPSKPALNTTAVWSQIKTGLAGLGVQAVMAPVIVILLGMLMKRDDGNV